MNTHETKICSKCGNEKDLSEFYKHKICKDGLRSACKECLKDQGREYNEEHKVEKKEYNNRFRKNRPWHKSYQCAKQRCNNPNAENYEYYGGKGIKFLMTEEEVKQLWIRDKAHNLEWASIDREDNDGNYIFENCRFIEFSENAAKNKRKSILQLDLNQNFIRKFDSVKEAGRILKIDDGNIIKCAKGKQKTCGGFIWKYKN